MQHNSIPRADKCSAFKHIQVDIQPEQGIIYLIMSPVGRPCFSLELLRELKGAQKEADKYGCKYLVLSSNIKGVFNLGGDLEYLREQIRRKNKQSLAEYMKACIDALHYESTVDGRVRIAVVQGDSFGGGFEIALCCDMIIAEENARFSFPESTFNLIPGMGAFSYLVRRTNMSVTKRIITSGRVYSAQEMFALGAIDQVVGPDVGMQAAERYIHSYRRRCNSYDAIRYITNSENPVTYDELVRIGSIWVDRALRLTDRDLRVMDKISSLQARYIMRK
ncbi:crotonase/enoyl-CoA hydratase family protein [Candidatus Thiosymbion oneisti]|uniref:crotonase/enoyl-CoA hydratase family protein n=1 Tax=Candidatus Thiosymbion oneisti TaxID=589554 RepID=UPI000A6AB8AD|nr:crotonase/enoyl-CoA hydratase family protein [Candidatus Thiosymbion oneisti]